MYAHLTETFTPFGAGSDSVLSLSAFVELCVQQPSPSSITVLAMLPVEV